MAKKIKKVEEVVEKKGLTAEEFLSHEPVSFTTNRCGECGGSGLIKGLHCPVCVGTGLERA